MDHTKLCAILTEFYTLLVNIGYIESDMVSWAPHKESPLPIVALRQQGFEECAIQLLQAIPLGKTRFFIYDHTTCVTYHDPRYKEYLHRAPYFDTYLHKNDPILRNHQVGIMASSNRYGKAVVINARTGILYSWYVESEDFEDAEEQDAVNHFKQAVEEIQTLEVIPLEFRGANFQDEESGSHYHDLKNMLLEYGWPDQFKKEEFRAALPIVSGAWKSDRVFRKPEVDDNEEGTERLDISDQSSGVNAQEQKD